ncbi:MAG: sirohydrochlorin cobaltochelatase [Thermoguttaceae bacterium]
MTTTAQVFTIFALLIMTNITNNRAAGSDREQSPSVDRPAIVLVAFGTTNPEARKVFDHFDAVARKRYPKHDIRWALTSQFVLAKLKKQGIEAKGLDEVVAELQKEGRGSVVFQSLHVAPGQEYSEIHDIDTSGMRVAVGSALLADDESIDAVIKAIAIDIEKDAFNVVACHGNRRHPEFNRQLVALAKNIEAKHANRVVCSVNGQPGTERLAEAKSGAAKLGKVHFIPLMLVAGVHVKDDVLGEESTSWKNIVAAKETTCAKPLGYRQAVLEVYFKHLDAALAKLEGKQQSKNDK